MTVRRKRSAIPRRADDSNAPWDAVERRQFRLRLIRWYQRHARDLPWRRTQDPYAIWISEVMLQQTQVGTVIPYYHAFLARFPDLGTLARAHLTTVLRYWEGLGYYRRARQLHAASRGMIREHRGQFPQSGQALRALPGIGRYTAGAILSLAFDQPMPILEANTTRLWCRLLAVSENPAQGAVREQLWSMASDILPDRGAGQINQALMELGSQICRPKIPDCHRCPVVRHCRAFRQGTQDQLPRKARAPAIEHVTEAAVVIRRNGSVLLRKCQDEERWSGLWDFPRFRLDTTGAEAARELATRASRWAAGKVVIGAQRAMLRHSVTRFQISLLCFDATLPARRRRLPANTLWVPVRELPNYPLNVTARRLTRQLSPHHPDHRMFNRPARGRHTRGRHNSGGG